MTIYGAVLEGIQAVPVRVTVEPGPFEVRGLSEHAARETRVRVKASFASFGQQPSGVVTVARVDGAPIGPGAALDLAVAVAASGLDVPVDVLFAGELSLGGDIRGVRGEISIALITRNYRIQGVIGSCARLPAYMQEMAGVRLFAGHLREVFEAIECANLPSTVSLSNEWLLPLPSIGTPNPIEDRTPAWSEISPQGQPAAAKVREAVEAGARVLVLVGPPGCGKTMVARRIGSILPALTEDERFEVDLISCAAGLGYNNGLTRPFRAPHHTASTTAIVGGGTPIRPGEMTIAHHGVMFFDEANEMPRAALDAAIAVTKRGYSHVARMALGSGSLDLVAKPAVVVFAITPPSPRDTSRGKDGVLTTREKAALDSANQRVDDLIGRLKKELDAVVIEMPRVDVKAMAAS